MTDPRLQPPTNTSGGGSGGAPPPPPPAADDDHGDTTVHDSTAVRPEEGASLMGDGTDGGDGDADAAFSEEEAEEEEEVDDDDDEDDEDDEGGGGGDDDLLVHLFDFDDELEDLDGGDLDGEILRRHRRPPWDGPNRGAAAPPILLHSSDGEGDHRTGPGRPPARKRLRRTRSFAEPPPPGDRLGDLARAVVPGAERTRTAASSPSRPHTTTTTTSDCCWDRLPVPLQLAILQFATVPDLVAVRRADRARRQLLLDAAAAVWIPACHRRWPWVNWDAVTGVRVGGGGAPWVNRDAVTDVRVGGGAAGAGATANAAAPPATDYARILLDWAAAQCSHAVDAARFPPDVQFVDDGDDGGSSRHPAAIRYTGAVGFHSRCVRAATPLPRPAGRIRVRCRHHGVAPRLDPPSPAEWQLLTYVEKWKPFVAPYALSRASVSLQPRLVSYFEVTLLPPPPPPPGAEPAIDHRHLLARSGGTRLVPRDAPRQPQPRADCVAIGVARDEFFRYHRDQMPGWTVNSHGYHSDDGRYYHGGVAAAHYHHGGGSITDLPFGPGDCVGCGIDYLHRGGRIFFCKNGARIMSCPLGDEALTHDWYPVVELDSRCPVTVNFGTRTPFQFDLAAYVANYQRDQVVMVRRPR